MYVILLGWLQKHLGRLGLGLGFGLSVALGYAMPAAQGAPALFVIRVVDGDTFWGQIDSGRRIKVRILGIDAPEICQAYGRQAKQALVRAIEKQTIVLRNAHNVDDYGRRLATPYWQGQDMAAWLVHNGYAWNYTRRNSAGMYAHEQSQAQQTRKGLWTQKNPETPRHFRRRHGSCVPR